MRTLSFLFVWMVAAGAATAWGQYGLYGSPELLRLSQTPAPVPSAYPVAPTSGYAAWPDTTVATGPTMQPVTSAPAMMPAGYPVTDASRAPMPTQSISPQFGQPAGPRTAAVQPYYTPTSAPAMVQPVPVAPVPQGGPAMRPGVVDQMLNEARPYGPAPTGGYAGNGYPGGCGYANNGYASGNGPFCQSADAACAAPACCPWYGSVMGLYMGRDTANRVWTSYETGNNSNQLMNTGGDIEWRAGGEVRIGRRFCCGSWSVEGVYWTLDNFCRSDSVSVYGGTVSTPLMVDGIEFDGVNGQVYFDDAAEHCLWRRNELHNLEVNLFRNSILGCGNSCGGNAGCGSPCGGNACGGNPCGSNPWDLDLLVGVRFLRFREQLIFGALEDGCSWGEDYGEHEAYLDEQITNNLLGFQFGVDLGYRVTDRCRLFATPKFGLYDNHITGEFRAYRGDGVIANPTEASGETGSYPVCASKDVLSFLTQIDVGLQWNFTCNLGAQIGYRVVAVTNVGLADHQIPFYAVDIPELGYIKSNGDLILHGAFAGLTYNF